MENNFLENIAFQENLKQSEVFGKQYEDRFEEDKKSAFNPPLYSDVEDVLNHILYSYDSLSEFQKDMLYKIFEALNKVRHLIDPNRLRPFEQYLNSDEELLLYRNTDNGLTNIIINPDECVAYSFINKEKNERVLLFFDENSDFESLVYKFFSN